MAEQQTKPPEAQPEGEQHQEKQEQVPDNAAIRAMRAETERAMAEAREAREQLKVLQVKLTERQRAEMSEAERMRAELEETRQYASQADQLREKLGGLESWLQREYDSELAKVPDEADRDTLRRMSSTGDSRERLEALKGAKVLYSQRITAEKAAEKAKADLEAAKQQTSYGTRTQPAAQRTPQQPMNEPRKFDRSKIPEWSAVLSKARRPGNQTEQNET